MPTVPPLERRARAEYFDNLSPAAITALGRRLLAPTAKGRPTRRAGALAFAIDVLRARYLSGGHHPALAVIDTPTSDLFSVLSYGSLLAATSPTGAVESLLSTHVRLHQRPWTADELAELIAGCPRPLGASDGLARYGTPTRPSLEPRYLLTPEAVDVALASGPAWAAIAALSAMSDAQFLRLLTILDVTDLSHELALRIQITSRSRLDALIASLPLGFTFTCDLVGLVRHLIDPGAALTSLVPFTDLHGAFRLITKPFVLDDVTLYPGGRLITLFCAAHAGLAGDALYEFDNCVSYTSAMPRFYRVRLLLRLSGASLDSLDPDGNLIVPLARRFGADSKAVIALLGPGVPFVEALEAAHVHVVVP